MEDLAIIDYNIGEIHMYKVPYDVEITDEYINSLGHKGKDCYWMIGEKIKIVQHESV